MTIADFIDKCTPEQRATMCKLQQDSGIAWEDFLKMALAPTKLHDYVALPNFHNMYVGIEKDGNAHT